MLPSAVFERCLRKLFDLEVTYWNSFCPARYFSWNIISRKAQCIWRAPRGTVWHSGINRSLCCFVGLTSSPDSSSRTDCWRVWWEIPVAHLTPHWTHLIFICLTEAAVGSITTWYCSSFCQASRLKSHLPVLRLSLSLAALDQELKGAEPGWLAGQCPAMTSVLLHDSVAASAAAPSYPARLPDLSFSSRNSFRLISASLLLVREGTTFTWEALRLFPPPPVSNVMRQGSDWEKHRWGKILQLLTEVTSVWQKKKFPHVNTPKPNA